MLNIKRLPLQPQAKKFGWSIFLAILVALLFLIPQNPGPYRAVPEQTSVLIALPSALSTGKEMEKLPASIWKDLLQQSVFKQGWLQIAQVENLFHHHSEIRTAFANHTLLLAYSLIPTDSMAPLMILDLGKAIDLEAALMGKDAKNKVFPYKFHQNTLYSIHVSKTEKLVVALSNKQLICSKFSYLVEDAISQLEKPRTWWSNQKKIGRIGSNSAMNIIIRPGNWVAHQAGRVSRTVEFLADQFEWIGIGWNRQEATVIGETKGLINQSVQWKGAPPEKILSVLPDQTAYCAWAGFNDRLRFMASLGGEHAADFTNFVQPWLGNELAWAATDPATSNLAGDRLLILGISSASKAAEFLNRYGETRGMLVHDKIGMFDMYGFQSNTLLAPFLSDAKTSFLTPYCALLGEYAIFASNRHALEICVEKYINNQTLIQNVDLLQLVDRWQKKSRAMVLINGHYFSEVVNALYQSGKNQKNEFAQSFSKLGWVSVDCLPQANRSAILKVDAQKQTTAPPNSDVYWETPLAAPVVKGIYKVDIPGETSKALFFAQDATSVLYCLNLDGDVLWQRRLGSKMLSGIIGVRALDKGRIGFIFNTAEQIWLLDESGQLAPGYPQTLKTSTEAPISLVYFNKEDKPCYFISCTNGHIYGYRLDGRALQGWNPLVTPAPSKLPLSHIQYQGKDYLACLDQNSQLSVFDSDGFDRFKKVQLSGRFETPIVVLPHKKQPAFVCINQLGKVAICALDGKVIAMSLQNDQSPQQTPYLTIAGRFENTPGIWALQGKQVGFYTLAPNQMDRRIERPLKEKPDAIFETELGLGMLFQKKHKIDYWEGRNNRYVGFPLAGATRFVFHFDQFKQIAIAGTGSAVAAYKLERNSRD